MWRDENRPEDNRAQAFAAAEAQLLKLNRSDEGRAAYNQVLLCEYAELDWSPTPKNLAVIYLTMLCIRQTLLQ